jgi:hypothetical protein
VKFLQNNVNITHSKADIATSYLTCLCEIFPWSCHKVTYSEVEVTEICHNYRIALIDVPTNVPEFACMVVHHCLGWYSLPLRVVNGELPDCIYQQMEEVLEAIVCNLQEKASLKATLDMYAQIMMPVEEVFNKIVLLSKCRLLALAKLLHELQ